MEHLPDLLSALVCPVCYNFMTSPITQCSNGHNTCHRCRPKLQRCPICRGDLTGIRNKLVEDLSEKLVQPCKYERSGCTRVLRSGKEEEHEKICRYGLHKCPFVIIDSIICKWEGASTRLEQHIRNEHKGTWEILTSGIQSTTCPGYMLELNGVSWYRVLFKEGKIFFAYSKLIDNFLYICFMYVGTREDNYNSYRYTVTIQTPGGRHSGMLNLPCPFYQEILDGNFPNGKCVAFHSEFARLCLDVDGKLPYEYEIMEDWKLFLKFSLLFQQSR